MVIHEITVTCSFVILHDYKHENYDEIVPYGIDYMGRTPYDMGHIIYAFEYSSGILSPRC